MRPDAPPSTPYARLGMLLLIGLLASCTTAPSGSGAPSGPSSPSASPYRPRIDPANFVSRIDNPFYPLSPGSRYVYEGPGNAGHERAAVEVTTETRVVMGVTCVVVHDRVTTDGQLTEDTYDWYAQDTAGNVWYFGEDTKRYVGGQLAGSGGSWEAGVDGAQPGIIMLADQEVGVSYREEYLAGHAEDMGEVISVSESADVPFGSYRDLVMIADTTPLEPNLVEHKYYASGVGLVLDVTVSGGSDRGELVEVTLRHPL